MQGQPADGGLYIPCKISGIPAGFLDAMRIWTFPELAANVANFLLPNEIPEELFEQSFPFDAPLVRLSETINVLELFHGPTLAFKDFGARFLSSLLSYYLRSTDKELIMLVATSGDTGSAVASAFQNAARIRVVVLYPSGLVSRIQEQQMTTIGGNITALEVKGTFDDCQRMVKQAFADDDLRRRVFLTSANSINIARLLPQSFYYFRAFAQLPSESDLPVFSVPSGNFGNLTAGLLAKRMGLPVSRFVAATNVNQVVPAYLKSGRFEARPSVSTVSNAMDVGNPSNFARMLALFHHDVEQAREELYGASFNDDQTIAAIREIYDKYGYVMDPHGAVAYLGWKQYRDEQTKPGCGIILATAHPAKFQSTVEATIGKSVEMPQRLAACLTREKQSVVIDAKYEILREFLMKE